MPQQLTLFAVMLGTGGMLAQARSGGATVHAVVAGFTQPIARRPGCDRPCRTVGTCLIPTLVLPFCHRRSASGTPSATRWSTHVHVHGRQRLFASRFFSTVFNDVWRPALIVLCVAVVVALAEQVTGLSRHGVYGLMSGEVYFRDGVIPWLGLLASAVVTAAAIAAAVANIARQDF